MPVDAVESFLETSTGRSVAKGDIKASASSPTCDGAVALVTFFFIEGSPAPTHAPHGRRLDLELSDKEVGTMRKNLRRAALIGGVATVAIMVPTGVALAATSGPGPGPNRDPVATCTHDQDRDRLRDGTGPVHEQQPTTDGVAYGHRSGAQDGTGPRAEGPLDGAGNMWGHAEP